MEDIRYLRWFATFHDGVEGVANVAAILQAAEQNWEALAGATPTFFMEEARNDGRWIRPWRIALAEYSSSV